MPFSFLISIADLFLVFLYRIFYYFSPYLRLKFLFSTTQGRQDIFVLYNSNSGSKVKGFNIFNFFYSFDIKVILVS